MSDDGKGDGNFVGDFDPSRVDPDEAVGPAAHGGGFTTPDDVLTAGWDPDDEQFEHEKEGADAEEPDPQPVDSLEAPPKKEANNAGVPQRDSGPPMSEQMESPDLTQPDRGGSDADTDLNPHGAPDQARQRIQDRIDDLKNVEQGEGQVEEDGQQIVEEQVQKREQEHEDFQSHPTDLSVDRNVEQSSDGDTRTDMENTPGNANMSSRFNSPKMASKPLEVLAQPGVSPIRIMVELDDAWGEEWRDWEFETIYQTAHNEGVDIERQNQDKIMALKVVLNTDFFWEKARVFGKVCLAFNDNIVDWEVVQEPAVHEMAATRALVERYIDENAFSDEVKTFIAGVAIHSGFIMLPPKLRFAKGPFSKKLMENMGDAAIEKQEKLIQALEQNNPELVDRDGQIQFFRLLRCHYHAQEALDNV